MDKLRRVPKNPVHRYGSSRTRDRVEDHVTNTRTETLIEMERDRDTSTILQKDKKRTVDSGRSSLETANEIVVLIANERSIVEPGV